MTSIWGAAPSPSASRNSRPFPPGTSASAAPSSGMASAAVPVPAPLPASHISQRPSLAKPIRTTSYLAGSRARNTFAADALETSCSAEQPPNNNPTVILGGAFDIVILSLGGGFAFDEAY